MKPGFAPLEYLGTVSDIKQIESRINDFDKLTVNFRNHKSKNLFIVDTDLLRDKLTSL